MRFAEFHYMLWATINADYCSLYEVVDCRPEVFLDSLIP